MWKILIFRWKDQFSSCPHLKIAKIRAGTGAGFSWGQSPVKFHRKAAIHQRLRRRKSGSVPNNTYYWNLYIGVQALDWDNDFIYCYHYDDDNTTYSDGHVADGSGTGDYFKGLIHLASAKSGLYKDHDINPGEGIEMGHYSGTVCVLMYQPTLRGYMLRQVDFGKQTVSGYYTFEEDFAWNVPASSEIVWPEAFALGKQWYDVTNRYRGLLYIMGSRNGDLEANHNIMVYQNSTS